MQMANRAEGFVPPRWRVLAASIASVLGILGVSPSSLVAQSGLIQPVDLGSELEGNVEIPTLGTSDGETIYCVYSNNTNSIWIQATTDAGRTWSKPVRVMGLPSPRYITDANILVDGHRLTVFATHVLDLPDQPGRLARSRIQVAHSEDGGSSWSRPSPLPLDRNYAVGCVHAPVWLKGDTVVMGYSWDVPAQEQKPASAEGGMFLKSGVLISSDRGRTWRRGQDVEVAKHPIGADEPAIVRVGNDELFMVVRTSHPRPYECRSHDGGRTWTQPRPSNFFGYNSPTALLRLRDGRIVRAWNNSPTERFPLVVSLSNDGCRSWTVPRIVAEPNVHSDGTLSYTRACYPSLAEASDGTLLLAWWQRDQAGRNRVKCARLQIDWITDPEWQKPPIRVVALGDSVTRGVRPGVKPHETFCYFLERSLRDRGIRATVANAGIGGDTTTGGRRRFQKDVVASRPAVVIIQFGLNDAAMVDGGPVARATPRVSLEDYRENLQAMVAAARQAGIQVVLCTPSPMTRRYAHRSIGAYAQTKDINFMVRRYADAVRAVSNDQHVPCVDLFELFTKDANRLNLIKDGVHPYREGHKLIADALTRPVLMLLEE